MTLGDGVVQRRLAVAVGRVQRALVLQQEVHHGHGADGRGAVEGVLAAPVPHAGRRRGLVREEPAGDVEVVLGGDEVDDGLYVCMCEDWHALTLGDWGRGLCTRGGLFWEGEALAWPVLSRWLLAE